MEKLENGVSIFGSEKKVWGLTTIPSEQLGANLVQLRRGKRGTFLLHTSWKEHQQPHFIFPYYK
jgi:hypothetical protein